MWGVLPPQAQNSALLHAEFQKVLVGTMLYFQKVLLGQSFVTWCTNHFPSLSIIFNLLQGECPWSHGPNHWWRHWTISDHCGTLLVTGLQLDIKPLAITLFNPGSTTIFQATLLHPTFSQLENKNPVGGGVKNVTRQCTLYLPLSLHSHSLYISSLFKSSRTSTDVMFCKS